MVLVTQSPDSHDVTPDGTKTTQITSFEKNDGQRRLVEYLVVVSSIPRIKDGEHNKNNGNHKNEPPPVDEQWQLSTSFDDEDIVVQNSFKPEITARYPLNDHEDNPLDDNVTFFCHPSGAIHLKKEPFLPKVRLICFVV
jgi:hypothetical protein